MENKSIHTKITHIYIFFFLLSAVKALTSGEYAKDVEVLEIIYLTLINT
jgi:hypothetical protein